MPLPDMDEHEKIVPETVFRRLADEPRMFLEGTVPYIDAESAGLCRDAGRRRAKRLEEPPRAYGALESAVPPGIDGELDGGGAYDAGAPFAGNVVELHHGHGESEDEAAPSRKIEPAVS